MRYLGWLFVVVGANVVATSAQTDCRNTGERYKVYDAVLSHMFAGNKVTFDTQARIEQLIIRDTTTTESTRFIMSSEQVKIRLRDLPDELIKDYESRHDKSTALSRCFDIKLKYSLISSSDFSNVFSQGDDTNHRDEEWTKFYQKFPMSGGYVSLSNAGFDKTMTHALVYMVHWCGFVCGTGHYIYLQKSDSGWTVKLAPMMWIS